LTFSLGIILGGAFASVLQLKPPFTPAGMNVTIAALYMLLSSPLLALALAFVARGLGGTLVVRAAVLAIFTWIAYTVNTQLEAQIFTTFAIGFWYTLVDFAVPAILVGAVIAFLFPASALTKDAASEIRDFFRQHSAAAWAWRLALGAVAFMPVYWLFGMMVIPFTAQYYQEHMFGLTIPPLEQLLLVLFVRSVLFLLACLPIIVLWQTSARGLFWSLGFALFMLVGLLNMLAAEWMPVSVRLPHTIEILADEFVYAGVLVLLLTRYVGIRGLSRASAQSGAI
jgi:hypothetical protein